MRTLSTVKHGGIDITPQIATLEPAHTKAGVNRNFTDEERAELFRSPFYFIL